MTTAPARRPSPADLAARLADRDRRLIEPGTRSESDEPFRELYERAVLGSSMTPHSRLVALVLIAHAEPVSGSIPESAQPRLKGLCTETGLHPGHVVVALNTLFLRGWLRRIRPGRERWDTACVQPTIPAPVMRALLKN